ncbi:FCD domain-containing protein [bacterium]|nr:FCD domain-containing protein [bacterium]
MTIEKLARVESSTLKENVCTILRRSIIDGTLTGGMEINQAQIAEQLGVSRGPLREALGQLEFEGLVESTPYKGVVVTALTRESVEDLYSVRAVLENLAIRRAVDYATVEELATLDRIVDEMRIAALAGDREKLGLLDIGFHEQIVSMARNTLLKKLWKLLAVSLQRCLYARHSRYESLEHVVGSHPAIVAAITVRDKEESSRILRIHMAEWAEQILAEYPVVLVEEVL